MAVKAGYTTREPRNWEYARQPMAQRIEPPMPARQPAEESESGPVSWRGTTYAVITIVVLLGAFIAVVAQMSSLANAARRLSIADAGASGASLRLLSANAPAITATAGYVFDANTGVVLYSKDSDYQRPIASCTKIMTALLAV